MSLSKFRLPDLREAGERSRWRTLLHQGSRIAENDRSEEITEKRIRRKNPDAARDRGHNCTDCGKRCASAAGLAAHRRWKHSLVVPFISFVLAEHGLTFNIYIYIYIYIYIKVRLMKPTHDSLLLRVSCLRTHQTVFNKENSYHLVYIQACEKLLLFA